MILLETWCYATWSSLALGATLHDLHLNLMLRYMIWLWCYAAWFSLERDATLWSSLELDAALRDLHLNLMLRYMIFTWTWCYATWSSLELDATLHDLHLHSKIVKNHCHNIMFKKRNNFSDFQKTHFFRVRNQNFHVAPTGPNKTTISCDGNLRKRRGVLSVGNLVVSSWTIG